MSRDNSAIVCGPHRAAPAAKMLISQHCLASMWSGLTVMLGVWRKRPNWHRPKRASYKRRSVRRCNLSRTAKRNLPAAMENGPIIGRKGMRCKFCSSITWKQKSRCIFAPAFVFFRKLTRHLRGGWSSCRASGSSLPTPRKTNLKGNIQATPRTM